jgi:excisionase family DNA binding protein
MHTKDLLTEPEAAEILGIATATLRRWLQGGQLPYFKLGKKIWIDPADVQAFIMHNRVSAPEHPVGVA